MVVQSSVHALTPTHIHSEVVVLVKENIFRKMATSIYFHVTKANP